MTPPLSIHSPPQSEVYQKGLGPKSLPSEYYTIPTDHYLPMWFGWQEFETALPADAPKAEVDKAKLTLPVFGNIYEKAATFFN